MSKLEKLTEKARPHLDPSEEVLAAVQGTYETKLLGEDHLRTGILMATNSRLVFYAKKLTGYDLESFPYPNISSIEMGKNMMGQHIKLFASGNQVTVKWIKDGNLNALIDVVRSKMNKSPISTQAPSQTSVPEQIKQLAELRDQGLLSEAEFQTKKTQLLDSM